MKMSAGGNSPITAWRGLMASKGLSGAAPVLEGYGLSCEHDLSLLVQEDLNTLSNQLTPFHSRILRTWVQGLTAEDQHHKRDKKRGAGNVNDAPAAKKHSNVCVCVMRYIFISVLFSLGVRGVCVRCGYEDRIHFGRILEEL